MHSRALALLPYALLGTGRGVHVQELMQSASVEDIRGYLRGLFVAIRDVHALGLVHCDIKPNNILFNRDTMEVTLIDLGHVTEVCKYSSISFCCSYRML